MVWIIAGPPNLATVSNYFIQDARLDRLDKVKFSLLKTTEKLYRYSPLTHVTNITKPLLVMQEAKDTRVPQAESDQMVEAMNKNNIPVIYTLYKDDGYNFYNEANKFSFYAIAERFLAKHLGGRFEPFDDKVLNNPNLVLNGSIPSEKLLENLLNK